MSWGRGTPARHTFLAHDRADTTKPAGVAGGLCDGRSGWFHSSSCVLAGSRILVDRSPANAQEHLRQEQHPFVQPISFGCANRPATLLAGCVFASDRSIRTGPPPITRFNLHGRCDLRHWIFREIQIHGDIPQIPLLPDPQDHLDRNLGLVAEARLGVVAGVPPPRCGRVPLAGLVLHCHHLPCCAKAGLVLTGAVVDGSCRAAFALGARTLSVSGPAKISSAENG